ncbi:hypothetical protein LTR15_011506 [Elasticomyces elasticus]|nr:hypothetical protein LTR15_011506 [Elasticomyces elasticus]
MPEKWDAVKDQELLLLILEHHKIDCKKVAESWTAKYGTGVTNRAITQHLQKLSKDVGGSTSGGGGGTPRKPAGTPKAPVTTPRNKESASKSAASGNKRGHGSMSDDDDDEPTMHSGSESPSKRVKMERRSKTPKSYAAPESDDDENLLANHGSTNESGAEGIANGEVGDLDDDDDAFEPAFH